MGVGAVELLLVIMSMFGGQSGLPLGLPPGPEDPLMFQFAPDDCLFYTGWSSTVTLDESRSVTEKWMAQPEIQNSFQQLKDAFKALVEQADPDDREFATIGYDFAERLLTNQTAFYVRNVQPSEQFAIDLSAGALIHLGDDAREFADKASSALADIINSDKQSRPKKVTIDGVDCWQVLTEDEGWLMTWGVVKNRYLALAIGEGEMEKLIANLETERPDWIRDLQSEIPVDRASSTTWLNIDKALKLGKQAVGDNANPDFDTVMNTMGLSQMHAAGWISGLEKEGFVCRAVIGTEAEPTGFLGLFSNLPLETDHFGKIPNDRMLVAGASISPQKILDLVRDINDLNQWSRGDVDRGIEFLNDQLGLDFRKDVIEALDDRVVLYGSINFAKPTTGWVLGIGASNAMQLSEPFGKINNAIKSALEFSDFQKYQESKVNETIIYSVSDERGWGVPFAWTMVDGELLISFDTGSLRRHVRRKHMGDDSIARDEYFASLFDPPRMEAEGPLLVSSLDLSTLISVGVPMLGFMGDDLFPPDFDFELGDIPSVDSLTQDMKPNLTSIYRTPQGFEIFQQQTYPGGTPGTLMGAAFIGLAPSVVQVRRAARRTDSANRMRQIVLAMHNFHDANRGFPALHSTDGDGNKLLSWRVHLLPYLEEQDLYNEFHLDEPWDSEHNKALITRMPDFYIHPSVKTEAGKTAYVVPNGAGTVFNAPENAGSKRGITLENIPDGTSRTAVLLTVKAEHAVPWTKPDGFDWSSVDNPVDALFNGFKGGFNVSLADGSVQFISSEKMKDIFEKLVKRNDGEAIEIWDR